MRISVIGLGSMGSALARVLVERDCDVTVWNRSAEKAAPLVKAGAVLAPTPRAAIDASEVTLICIQSHSDTHALLSDLGPALRGKTIVELSTGDTRDAKALYTWVCAQGAKFLIGMIATFPGDIGKPDSSIVTVGQHGAWEASAPALRLLGGRSSYIGEDISALPALFAGLFLPRQGFMFGMIYGALVCEKAGVSMDDYVAQIPLTLKVVHDYFDIFAQTVPSGDFSDPPASVDTYAAAFRDVLETFRANGVSDELPALLSGLMEQAVEAGYGDKQLTSLTQMLRR